MGFGLGVILITLAKFMVAAVVMFLCITLMFLFTDVFGVIMDFALNKMAGTLDLQAQVLEFTGTAAYFAQQLRFQDALAFILSAVFAKWLLRKIPFVKW